MFPSIDMNYAPNKYTFTYLLSPATKWESFADLDIAVNTEAYILDGTIDFQKTDDGYTVHLDSLPDGELEFVLCESNDPELSTNIAWTVFGIVMGVTILVCLIGSVYFVATLIIFIVLLTKYKNRRQRA